MHHARQIEPHFAAAPVDRVALDALLRFEQLRAARRIAGNHRQHRRLRSHAPPAQHSQTQPQTHTPSMSRRDFTNATSARMCRILPTVSWC